MTKPIRYILPLTIAFAAIAGLAGQNMLPRADEAAAWYPSGTDERLEAAPFSLRGAWRDIGRNARPEGEIPTAGRPLAEIREPAVFAPEPFRASATAAQPTESREQGASAASIPDTAAQGRSGEDSNPGSRAAQQSAAETASDPQPSSMPEPKIGATALPLAAETAAQPSAGNAPTKVRSEGAAKFSAVSKTATSALRDNAPTISSSDDEPPLPVRRTISSIAKAAPPRVRHRTVVAHAPHREVRMQSADVPEAPVLKRVFRDLEHTMP